MNIFKIFTWGSDNDTPETEVNIEQVDTQNDIEQVEDTQNAKSVDIEIINKAIEASFEPYLETLTEMKAMLDKVQLLEKQTIEQSEKLNDTINQRVIEALANRGINQLEEKEVEINMSARDKLLADYKSNPNKFLSQFNQ